MKYTALAWLVLGVFSVQVNETNTKNFVKSSLRNLKNIYIYLYICIRYNSVLNNMCFSVLYLLLFLCKVRIL